MQGVWSKGGRRSCRSGHVPSFPTAARVHAGGAHSFLLLVVFFVVHIGDEYCGQGANVAYLLEFLGLTSLS